MSEGGWNIEVPPSSPSQIEKLRHLLYLLDKVEASELIVLLKKRADEKISVIRIEDGVGGASSSTS